MPVTHGEFLREGLKRWGRARTVLSAFEAQLGEELRRVGKAHAEELTLKISDISKAKPWVGDNAEPSIRVEFAGRIGRRPAELILGVEWQGAALEPHYYGGFCAPTELRRPLGRFLPTSPDEAGSRIVSAEGSDWVVVPVRDLTFDDGFAKVLGVLRRKVEAER